MERKLEFIDRGCDNINRLAAPRGQKSAPVLGKQPKRFPDTFPDTFTDTIVSGPSQLILIWKRRRPKVDTTSANVCAVTKNDFSDITFADNRRGGEKISTRRGFECREGCIPDE